MIHLFFSVPCLYVLGRFLLPMPWPVLPKLAVAVVLVLGSQYHFFSRLSSGSVFAPEFPRALVIAFNWAFCAILLLAVLQIALDLAALATALVRQRWTAIPPGVRYGAGGLAMLLSAIGVAQAIRVPPLKDVELRVANLPPRFEGYRLIQLTDLHISRMFQAPWTRAMVARANGLDADLIVVTGDVIDGSVAMRRADVAPLADLRARDGVWLIPGNHEYFFGYRQWLDHLAGLGMKVLENQHMVLRREGEAIVVAGVTDLSAAHTGNPPPDLDAALRGAPAGAPVILLDHQPREARSAARRGVAIQLSGHTHGGLIVGLDRLFARANAGFVSGLYQVGGMQLYVNNGTALWPGAAIRLGRPSELTRITLRRK